MTQTNHRKTYGSALILTVVLTSLLAMVGVLFALLSRMDKNTTRALQENYRLELVTDSLLVHIQEVLAEDVPHMDGSGELVQEAYDGTDANDSWLASLEPDKEEQQKGIHLMKLCNGNLLYNLGYMMISLKKWVDGAKNNFFAPF